MQLSYEFLFSNTLQILGQEFSYMQYKLADYVLTNFLLFFSGIKICGGCSRDGREVNGIFIKRILPGGLADQDGNFFSIPNVKSSFGLL